jgi:hypothetical protein
MLHFRAASLQSRTPLYGGGESSAHAGAASPVVRFFHAQ